MEINIAGELAYEIAYILHRSESSRTAYLGIPKICEGFLGFVKINIVGELAYEIASIMHRSELSRKVYLEIPGIGANQYRRRISIRDGFHPAQV